MTKDDLVASFNKRLASNNDAFAKNRIETKGGKTASGEKVCAFFTMGKCRKRAASRCNAGMHPKENAPDCQIVGCKGPADSCPFMHTA